MKRRRMCSQTDVAERSAAARSTRTGIWWVRWETVSRLSQTNSRGMVGGSTALNRRGGRMVGDDRVMICLLDGAPEAPHTAPDAPRQSAHPLPPQGLHGPRGRQGDRPHLRTARPVESRPSRFWSITCRSLCDRPRGEGFDGRPRADVRPSPGAVGGDLGRMSGLGEMAKLIRAVDALIFRGPLTSQKISTEAGPAARPSQRSLGIHYNLRV
jgi:hypothetical protein